MKRKLFFVLCLTCLALLFVSCERKSLQEKYELALVHCDAPKVSRFLKKGIEADYEFNRGETALNFICSITHPDSYKVAEVLIQNGADVNSFSECTGSGDLVFANIEKNYCIAVCDTAAKVELLIKNGAAVDVDCGKNITPLMYYLDSPNFNWHQDKLYEIVKVLLENGADPNHKSDEGFTPFLIALQNQNRDIVDLFVEHGAEIHEDYVHVKANPFRNTAFEDRGDLVDYNFSELTSVCSAGYVDLLKGYLQNHKVDLFSHSGDGIDCFVCGVESDNPEMVEFLLPFYGNINSRRYTLFDMDNKPTYGYTLYGIASHFLCDRSVRVLLDHGADGFSSY